MLKNNLLYRHRRSDNNEIFYIGMANNMKRPYDGERNKIWKSIVRKLKGDYKVEIIVTGLTRSQASSLERLLIAKHGRLCLKTGRLANIADGGEGGDTFSNNPNKEQIREKIRKNSLEKSPGATIKAKETRIKNGTWGLKRTQEDIEKWKKTGIENGTYGVVTKESSEKISKTVTNLWKDPEYRAKVSKGHKGRVFTKERKNSISEAWKNKPLLGCEYCDFKSISRSNIVRFHNDNCKLNPNKI